MEHRAIARKGKSLQVIGLPVGTFPAISYRMNTNLLATLRAHFGTVSSLTDASGVVAVRNVTAYRKLLLVLDTLTTQGEVGYSVSAVTSETTYPRLVRVTEQDDVDAV